ncbi:MAG: putative lipoprotein [Spirochaetes bacterium]|nr:MAG: putative lipoprotein [Spirochaetota bacterium]
MKFYKLAGILGASMVLILGLASCAETDVVAKFSKSSFRAVLDASGERAAKAEGGLYWSLASPQGDQVLFAADFAGTSKPDLIMSFDAKPFLAAGLDMAKLEFPAGTEATLEGERLTIKFELGDNAFSADAGASFATAFDETVRTNRARIGYHAALDHYGISVGGGNMFEWSKDMKKNDKDIVWVLDPAPFAAAGVDPGAVGGWLFAKVETMDESGKTVFVDKLLKPFNID